MESEKVSSVEDAIENHDVVCYECEEPIDELYFTVRHKEGKVELFDSEKCQRMHAKVSLGPLFDEQ